MATQLVTGLPKGYDFYVLKVFHTDERDGYRKATVEQIEFDDVNDIEMYCLTHEYTYDPDRDLRSECHDDLRFLAVTVWVEE